jgi:hypothetical protein
VCRERYIDEDYAAELSHNEGMRAKD